jgi:paraquat-inducible protein A
MSRLRIVACHECDALQCDVPLEPGRRARCVRCGAVLHRRPKASLDDTLAWTLSAVALLVIANSFPVVSLEVQGQETHATLFAAARALHDQGMTAIAALVLATLIVAPALELGSLSYLIAPLRSGRVAPGFDRLFRMVHALRRWQMFEVFMLGIFVAVVKLGHLASVIPGIGLWAFFGLMFTSVAAMASYDEKSIWDRVDAIRGGGSGSPRGVATGATR